MRYRWEYTRVPVESLPMPGYFVVLDPDADGSFVAGFGEQALAVAYATGEREIGRPLVVLDGGTGTQIYPSVPGATERPLRHSGMRLAKAAGPDGPERDD
jgi:hypothetical protein